VAALAQAEAGVRELQRSLLQRRTAALEGLRQIPRIHCAEPMGAFYVFPDVSAFYGGSGTPVRGSLDLAERLWKQFRVATVPGAAFGDDRCLRFSFAVEEETLKKGIKYFGTFLQNLLS
jgi:aspartate aminotransferase